MSNLISNLNGKNSTLNAATKLKKNINYIEKFGLSLNVAQYINS